MSNIENLCQRFKNTGLYTHVYVACGYLDDKKNLYEYFLSPGDGRFVFDLSSLTKALVTTPTVLWMCHEKSLDPKSATMSECFDAHAVKALGINNSQLKVADYLRHETGLPAWKNFYVECAGQRRSLQDAINSATTQSEKNDIYSDVGFLILTSLIENTKNQKIYEVWKNQCLKHHIILSNELTEATKEIQNSAISTGYCPVRGRDLIGEVHDENCWALGGATGHSGLFGSGEAVTSYLRSLWQVSAGKKIYEQNFAESLSKGESLMGWRKGRDGSANTFAEGRGCGHLGFTGTAFWVDPVTLSYAVVLTNRIISARISPEIKNFRREAFQELWDIIKTRPNDRA